MITTHTTLDDVRNLKPGHRFDADWRSFFDLIQDRPELEHYLATYCRSLWLGEQLIGIGGVTPLWDNVGEVWICLSDEAFLHASVVARHMVKMIETAQTVIAAHRIQITLAPKNFDFAPFIMRIGFKYEGTLHSYIRPGEDYQLYSKVFPHA